MMQKTYENIINQHNPCKIWMVYTCFFPTHLWKVGACRKHQAGELSDKVRWERCVKTGRNLETIRNICKAHRVGRRSIFEVRIFSVSRSTLQISGDRTKFGTLVLTFNIKIVDSYFPYIIIYIYTHDIYTYIYI